MHEHDPDKIIFLGCFQILCDYFVLLVCWNCAAFTMKFFTPQVSWHEREPLSAVDILRSSETLRVATAGLDRSIKVSKPIFDVSFMSFYA